MEQQFLTVSQAARLLDLSSDQFGGLSERESYLQSGSVKAIAYLRTLMSNVCAVSAKKS